MDSQLLDFPAAQADAPGTGGPVSGDAYRETLSSLENLSRLPFYAQLREAFREGSGKIELRKRYMLKAIDEAWVSAIEDTIPALDVIIRNPGVLLKETEKVVPIEQTRRVTSRSITHLVQHTDLINEIREDGSVMPSKLLNVYQDETVLTYENKFINTLLSRVYGFVSRRYESAEECGEDEKTTCLDFEQSFTREEQTGKIHLTIEISGKPREKEVVKNYIYTSDLWHRVQRIHRIILTYMDSDFVRRMQRSYIRPPVMRTNKLLKNVDFRQCLALWEFLEQYENTGYETLIQENLETVDEACIRDLYDTVAMQYLVFQKHIRNDFEEEKTLDFRATDAPLHPKIKEELDPLRERDFDQRDLIPDGKPAPVTETGREAQIEEALRVALAADAVFTAEEADGDTESVIAREGKILYRYRYSFLSRLIFAQDPTQTFYTQIKNALLSYKNVKSRISWNHEAFTVGKKKAARINVKGKTVFLYLPLDPKAYAGSKYRPVDVSDIRKNRDLPFLLKIRSDRGVKYARELIALVMESLSAPALEAAVYVDYHIPYATADELARRDPPLVRILAGAEAASVPAPEEAEASPMPELPEMASEFTYQYRYSFTARLIQAQEPVQDFYEQVKNYLLSFENVKCNMTWGYESFMLGRRTVARIKGRGKTLVLLLGLEPGPYVDSKYHVKDLSGSASGKLLPSQFKIRSPRAVKYAKELIDAVMGALDAAQGPIPQENYHLPPMTVEQMIALDKPLVKPAGGHGKGDSR